ncbi:MAG TPA: histone deacetylase [Bryobacterales bacterium]|jgi:acetoin utilization deacetylase AcuC-like enzyme|nr:histone deacetylase [Bryobacterales bacterium]
MATRSGWISARNSPGPQFALCYNARELAMPIARLRRRRQFLQCAAGAVLFACRDGTIAAPGSMKTALLADAIYKEHVTGPGHPERPERCDAVTEALHKGGLMPSLDRIGVRPATEEEIGACHTRAYIELVKREIMAGASELSTGDTNVGPRSLEVALRAAGGVLNAVDAVISRKARNAFCAVRPPGHHARPAQGMGFCIFNNVAIAARYAQRKHHVEKVLIADWDVHHGNGTQDIFYADGSVFFFSTHQSPWYPFTGRADETGEGNGAGCTMNCPFPAGSGREEIVGAFRRKLAPAAQNFRPDLVLISAGFDSRADDPLGRFTLSDEDFAELTAIMLEIADKHAGGRLVSVLEGGYNLPGLASAALSHVKALTSA